MNKIYHNADLILEKRLNAKPNWILTLLAFSFLGAVMVPSLFKDAFLEHGGTFEQLFIMTMTFLTISFLYGVIFGFGTTFIMLHILRFMNVRVKYSQLLKLFQISYLPYIIPAIVYIIRIILANYFETEFVQSNLFIIGLLYIFISLILLAVTIWVLVLIFRGMNHLTGLKFYQNLLVFFGSSLVLSPINIYLMYF